jgi:hypothetical protein
MDRKIHDLSVRADQFAAGLTDLGIAFFRSPQSNILTLHGNQVAPEIAQRFGLVPDNHHHPIWYKVVVMEHATTERLNALLRALKATVEVK